MKKHIILGKFPYDFVDETTGKRISGVTCFAAPEESDRGEGYYTKRYSYNPEKVTYEPGIMDSCVILFNEYGKIHDFMPCD